MVLSKGKAMAKEETKKEKVRRPKVVRKHRHCPVCWGGSQGVGDIYKSRKPVRYYVCDKCGNNFHRVIKNPIEYQEIELEERDK